ncbi:MAG: NADH-quinone oxidoreductase subunit K [Desulfurococcales archaeon]|nr:NADH-quinone oxidoreductase subunit K [Desulfurococcales archaeon]
MYADAIAATVIIASAVMAGIGVYGMTSSRNLIRQLLGVEILFNAAVLLILLLMSYRPADATLTTIVIVSVVSGEIIVIIALLAGMYRMARSLTSDVVEEGGV